MSKMSNSLIGEEMEVVELDVRNKSGGLRIKKNDRGGWGHFLLMIIKRNN